MRRLTGSLALWVCTAGFCLAVSLAGARARVEDNPPRNAARPSLPAAQDNAAKSSADSSGYVGAETCKTCHGDLYDSFEKTPHWKTLNDSHGGPSKQGCEGCHGPGAAHVQDPSGSPEFNFRTATPEAISDRCLSCHASGPDHMNATNSFHRQNQVGCTACHSPHHAKTRDYLLVKPQPELCYSCHLQQKSQFNMPFRHRVNEGLIQCTDCHNQHGSAGVWESDDVIRQVRTSSTGNFVCFKCHADKQGPFVFDHAPIRTEGCATCHIPHGGANPHMLKYSTVNLLCLRCHTAAAFGHDPDTGFPVMNAQNFTQEQACTMCHVQIHGSNFDRYLFK